MDIAVRRQGVPRAVLVFAVLALLIAVLVATVAFIGSRPSVPPLTGATNGLIAFRSGNEIVAINADGSGRRTLVSGAFELGPMAYSPDGQRLAYFARAVAGRGFDLIAIDTDRGGPVTVASGIGEVTSPSLAWSPDGSTIAYSARTPPRDGVSCALWGNGDFCTSRIFVASTDGSGVRQVGDPDLDARSPDWSPDGSTIAFGGGNATPSIGVHLYLMDADGSDVRQLSDVVGSDWAFVKVDWSRDGSKIVGQASAADDMSNWDIWVINADGSGTTNVGAHPQGVDEVIPSWAPDRDALVWWSGGIVLLEEGGDPVDIPIDMDAVWSPDGRLLAGTTSDGVIVVDLDGTVQMTAPGPAAAPAWQARYE
jgi:Tol biopolymer transport system component